MIMQSTVSTVQWCALHPTNCAAGQWSGLVKSLNSTVPTLWWCALHPTNCAAGHWSSLGQSLKSNCANSPVVWITPNKLNSWTMIRFGKKPTKNCANSPVVCTTPNKLCSWTMIRFGTEPKKQCANSPVVCRTPNRLFTWIMIKSIRKELVSVPTLQWCAQHPNLCTAGQFSSLERNLANCPVVRATPNKLCNWTMIRFGERAYKELCQLSGGGYNTQQTVQLGTDQLWDRA